MGEISLKDMKCLVFGATVLESLSEEKKLVKFDQKKTLEV